MRPPFPEATAPDRILDALRAQFVSWDEARATFTFPNGPRATVEMPIEEHERALGPAFGVSWWL